MAGIINAITGLGGVEGVLPGTNVTVTGTPSYPIVNSTGGGGGGVTSVTGGAGISVSPTTGAVVVSQINFRPSLTYYVAPNGNNTTGDGSEENPYQTITRALTQRATLSDTTEVAIQVAEGTYTENITIATNNTYVAGTSSGNTRQPANITGTITISIPSTTATTLNVGIANFTVSGNFVINCDTTPDIIGTFTLNEINLTAPSGVVGIVLTDNETTLHQIIINDSRINVGTGNVIGIQLNGGALQVINSIITNVGSERTIRYLNDGYTILRYCSILSTSTATGVQPLLNFENSTTAVGTNEVQYCTLRYTSTATDPGTSKCCIQFANTSTVNMFANHCLLRCVGGVFGTPNIRCINRVGAGAVNLTYGSLEAEAPATFIAPTITLTPFQQVNEGFYASFSSTATQNLSGANAPTTIAHNTTDFASFTGVTLVGGNIRVSRAAIYEIITSIQFDKSAGSSAIVYFWFQINGVDVPNSCSNIIIAGSTAETIGTVALVTPLNALDVVSVVFASADGTCQVLALPSQAAPYVRPANPSIITTVKLLT